MSGMMLGSLHAQVKKIDRVPDSRNNILGSRIVGENRKAEIRGNVGVGSTSFMLP